MAAARYVGILSVALQAAGNSEFSRAFNALDAALSAAPSDIEAARVLMLMGTMSMLWMSGNIGDTECLGLTLESLRHFHASEESAGDSELATWVADQTWRRLTLAESAYGAQIGELQAYVVSRRGPAAIDVFAPADDFVSEAEAQLMECSSSAFNERLLKESAPWSDRSRLFARLAMQSLIPYRNRSEMASVSAVSDAIAARAQATARLITCAPTNERPGLQQQADRAYELAKTLVVFSWSNEQRFSASDSLLGEWSRIAKDDSLYSTSGIFEKVRKGSVDSLYNGPAINILPDSTDAWWRPDFVDAIFARLVVRLARSLDAGNGHWALDSLGLTPATMEGWVRDSGGRLFLPSLVALALLSERDSARIHEGYARAASQELDAPYRLVVDSHKDTRDFRAPKATELGALDTQFVRPPPLPSSSRFEAGGVAVSLLR